MSQCAYASAESGLRCPCEARPGTDYCAGCERRIFEEHAAFEGWMRQVALAMEAAYGLHPDDLPDCPYADWHQAGIEPDAAVELAIEESL
jgi:hypothetical protein